MKLKPYITRYLKGSKSKLILVFLILFSSFCTKVSDKKELIFLITLDTTRADSINYKLQNKTTPNLAYLASEGISYKNAYSIIPITLPSHYSMFYSMPPWMIKIYNNGDKSNIVYPGLTEILKKKGFYTAAVISLGVLKSDFGLNKGFNSYKEDFASGLWYRTAEEVNSDLFKIIKKVKRDKAFYWVHYSDPHDPYFQPKYKGKFQLVLNKKNIYKTESTKSIYISIDLKLIPGKNILNFNTEIPQNFSKNLKNSISGIELRGFEYTSLVNSKTIKIEFPKDWIKRNVKKRVDYMTSNLESEIHLTNLKKESQFVKISFNYNMQVENSLKKKLYLEEISYMDKNIGDLILFLKKNDLFKYSTFIIFGDHGEGFGEYRNHIGHIHYHNKVYSNVPLIIKGKNIKKGIKKTQLVSNLNIAPTILDIANTKKPKYMIGESLLKTLITKHLFLETYRPQAYMNSFSIIEYPYQIIYFPERTNSDKYEFINLEKTKFGVKEIVGEDKTRRLKMIKKIRKITKKCLKKKKSGRNKTKKDIEMLRSLGYI